MKFQPKTKRIIIYGIILLSCVAAYGDKWAIFGVGLGILGGLITDDKDEE